MYSAETKAIIVSVIKYLMSNPLPLTGEGNSKRRIWGRVENEKLLISKTVKMLVKLRA